MENEQLIPADAFCTSHHIEISFIRSLHESGLVELTTIEEKRFVHPDQLKQLEKVVRMHYDMDINLEGIETISHLLQQMDQMQGELLKLKNRLRMYEQNEL